MWWKLTLKKKRKHWRQFRCWVLSTSSKTVQRTLQLLSTVVPLHEMQHISNAESESAAPEGAFLLSQRSASSSVVSTYLLFICFSNETNILLKHYTACSSVDAQAFVTLVIVSVGMKKKSNHQDLTWKGPLGLMSKNALFQSRP